MLKSYNGNTELRSSINWHRSFHTISVLSRKAKAPIIACSNYVRTFQDAFHPDENNIPRPYQVTYPEWLLKRHAKASLMSPENVIDDKSISEAGGFAAVNPYAHKTIMKPLALPQSQVPAKSDVWIVNIERNFNKELPRLAWQDGRLVFIPGFLNRFLYPDIPLNFEYSGLAVFSYTWKDRLVQGLAFALVGACAMALSSALWQCSPLLTAAIVVNWARQDFTLGNCLLITAFAFTGRMWLYWILFISKRVDEFLEYFMPPLRNFILLVLFVWFIYVWFSPLHWYPLPFPPFAPLSLGLTDPLRITL